ncbi:MAG: hypothetical protein ABSB15_25465, partial [Bryobacteraceae bacterium]
MPEICLGWREGGFATIAKVIQYRRLAALVLGMWLGAGIFADVAVTQNFQTVDRFLAEPGSVSAAAELNKVGRARERVILRRNAGEENNAIFENWERVELMVGCALLALLLFGARPNRLMLAAAVMMLVIVAVQHFFLSPAVTDLGRKLADLPGNDPLVPKFWTYHGIYSGSEILKLLVGFALAVRLAIRSRPDADRFAKEFEAQAAGAGNRAARVEQPRVEQPRVEQPRVEQPRVEQPRVEQPRVEQPRVEQP